MLTFLAGKNAYKRIQENGFHLSDIKMILGASGGPKWLMLSQLDRYIAKEWLPQIGHPIDLVGTSIGAWRMAMYANRNPSKTIDQFLEIYLTQRYTEDMTPSDISNYIKEKFIDTVKDIDLSDNSKNLNLVTARCRGPFSIEKNWIQGTAFFGSALGNMFSGKALDAFFERVTFATTPEQSPYQTLNLRNNRITHLTQDNLEDALMATGAIPMVLDTVSDISGGPKGVYIDGGMIDYHFNLPFNPSEGYIFYPHFSPTLKPGWFDKMLPWRTINPDHYDNILLMFPSSEFVEKLPYKKIPDRKDFDKFSDEERTNYWNTVLGETEALANELNELWQNQKLESRVKLLTKESLAMA